MNSILVGIRCPEFGDISFDECKQCEKCLPNALIEALKEWNYELNKYLTPDNITSGSNKKVWWRCIENNKHTWKASPKQRTKQNNSCPICNSLGVKFPHIGTVL